MVTVTRLWSIYYMVLWEPVRFEQGFPEDVNFNMRAAGWIELNRWRETRKSCTDKYNSLCKTPAVKGKMMSTRPVLKKWWKEWKWKGRTKFETTKWFPFKWSREINKHLVLVFIILCWIISKVIKLLYNCLF